MANPLYTVEQLPTTSQAAIREFDDRYLAYSGAALPPAWSTEIGDYAEVGSPMVTFPISALGVKYQKSSGQNRFKDMSETSFDIKVEEFDEGIQAKLLDLFQNSYAYSKWLQGPERLRNAEMRFRNRAIATLLEAGASTTGWDGENFFDTDHPANFADPSKGTWSNYQSSTKDVLDFSDLEAEVTAMQGAVLDEQGEKLGVDPDTILVPTAKYEPLKNMLAQALILDSTGAAAVTNPYMGKFRVVHVPELTDADDWFLVDSKLLGQGLPPWISLRYQAPQPLGLRYYDESSELFRDSGRIAVSSHVWYGFSLVMPHAIRLVKGA